MTTEWKDCTDPEELFRRRREGWGERLAKVEQQLAAANVLIAEQNKLGKERQEWALHTSDVIRSLNQQLAEALEQNLVLSKQTDHTILDLSNYVDSLEQQLAGAIAACKQKDESIEAAHNGLRWWMDAFPLHVTEADNEEMLKLVKALTIQPDDSALKAWLEMSNTADCRSQSSLQGVVK